MKKPKVLAAYSGGLDSTLAARVMVELGFEVLAIQFTSPFLGRSYLKESPEDYIRAKEATIGCTLRLVDMAIPHIGIVRNPQYGYGSQVNPCIDCKVLFFSTLRRMMEEEGALAIVTGEVMGQRPMSQMPKSLRRIEKLAGLEGKIVRPLSQQLMPEVELETLGLLDREKLYAFKNRSRKPQMQLAKELGITEYASPAGGCFLTDPGMARRIRHLMESPFEEMDEATVRLSMIGRQLILDEARLAIGRNETECRYLPHLLREGDAFLRMEDERGAVAILRGKQSPANHELAARILARYSARSVERGSRVLMEYRGQTTMFPADPVEEQRLERLLVV